jgi:hypothetical protein
MPMTGSSSTGGCACGAIRFIAEGEPYRVSLCHCLTCRKQYGAPFGAFVIFPAARVTWSGDGPAVVAETTWLEMLRPPLQ